MLMNFQRISYLLDARQSNVTNFFSETFGSKEKTQRFAVSKNRKVQTSFYEQIVS